MELWHIVFSADRIYLEKTCDVMVHFFPNHRWFCISDVISYPAGQVGAGLIKNLFM